MTAAAVALGKQQQSPLEALLSIPEAFAADNTTHMLVEALLSIPEAIKASTGARVLASRSEAYEKTCIELDYANAREEGLGT